MTGAKPRRCAIYTRKSSDEGLEQNFNSLDAQREAGEAYVRSQASEGWRASPAHYDDGGYSGGTMERPALQRLLADVEAGLIDVVVVYKIDRLTRSLADFARIVERFDAREASFVSVTQAFNTTSSMGRLTLNVLLSFAQFEREVTGERIRDKIAASKAKGMWMGGLAPLGYDLPLAGTRRLVVNEGEAANVRAIFARYLELASVHRLADELAAQGVRSKLRVMASGKQLGGQPLSRGALFHLLRNRLYLGKIVHRDAVYEGEHDAIVDPALFNAVQSVLDARARRHRARAGRQVERACLTGRIFDARGEPMSPAFSRGRNGRVYRYYVSSSLQQGAVPRSNHPLHRVPATTIETIAQEAIERLFPGDCQPMAMVQAVRLRDSSIDLQLSVPAAKVARASLTDGEVVTANGGGCIVTIPIILPLRGGRSSIAAGQPNRENPDPILIAALRKAHRMLSLDRGGLPTIDAAPKSPYDRRILRLALLAPDIQRAILAGTQPRQLNLESLVHGDVPIEWSAQRRVLGFST